MSIATITSVLGLALVDTLSPAVIGVALFLVLSRPRRLGLLLATFLLTLAAAYFTLGVLLMLGLGAVAPAFDGPAWAWVQAAVGAGLFIASWFIPTDRGTAPEPRVRRLTVPGIMLLGLSAWMFEFATAVPYFGAIGIMTTAGLEPVERLPLLGAYVVIMVLPGLLIHGASLALGEGIRARLQRWQDKLRGGSEATSWIIGIAGAVIFLHALGDLQL